MLTVTIFVSNHAMKKVSLVSYYFTLCWEQIPIICKGTVHLNNSLGNFGRRQISDIFPRKQDLTFVQIVSSG